MNTKIFLLAFALLWVSSLSLSAQTLVSVNKSITQDTLLTAIQRNSVSSKTVIASGQAVFSSNSGYVRILLSDDYGCDLTAFNEILNEKRTVTTDVALFMEAALGVPAYMLAGMQTDYNLQVAQKNSKLKNASPKSVKWR